MAGSRACTSARVTPQPAAVVVFDDERAVVADVVADVAADVEAGVPAVSFVSSELQATSTRRAKVEAKRRADMAADHKDLDVAQLGAYRPWKPVVGSSSLPVQTLARWWNRYHAWP